MSESLPAYPFYDAAAGTVPILHGADTPARLETAAELGYLYVETNVVATADGVAVAFHGPELWHLRPDSLRREEVESMTLTEASRTIKVGGQPLASLEELLVDSPDTRFFIDLKTPAAVRPTAGLINRLALHDRVSVGGSRYAYAQAVQEAVRPGGFVCTSFGTLGSLALLGTRYRLTGPRAEAYISQAPATQFVLPFQPVRSDTTERAHSRGRRVFVWSPNQAGQIAEAIGKGVNGVMSDEAALLKRLTDQAGAAGR